MRRHQFETYLDKVFDWTASVPTLAEGRHNPPHPWPKVFDAVFLGSACQFGPVHRIEAECKDGVLQKRIGPLSEDTIGYALQRQSPQEVFDLGFRVARQLKRNGVLHSDWARGRVVAAVEGIEQAGEVDGVPPRLSAVTVVSTPFPVFLVARLQKSGETEVLVHWPYRRNWWRNWASSVHPSTRSQPLGH